MDLLVGEKNSNLQYFQLLDPGQKKYIVFDSFADYLVVDRQALVDMTKNK